MATVDRLFAHNLWANDLWIDFVTANAPEDPYYRRTLSHILLAHLVWFERIEGEQKTKDPWQLLSPEQWRGMHADIALRSAHILQDDLTRVIHYRRFNGDEYHGSVADLLTAVALHSVHHRGQMAAHSTTLALKPPLDDYLSFSLRQGL
jgi:uncharacterized damage-inducible protein DinB